VKVTIHQPHYLPWLGYLAKWAEADLFIFLDTVQYEKNGFQNRNKIRTKDGARWLTVPVRAKLGTPIVEVETDAAQAWAQRHFRAIELAYARAPGWKVREPELRALYGRAWPRLSPLAVASATWLAEAVGIRTPARLASELAVTADDPTERLVRLCRAVGATTYLAGRDGATYMDLARFAAAGIEVRTQAYTHPIYPQLHGEFVPFLSALDLLLMKGNEALAILRQGDGWSRLGP
jgi:WbqC-like protein family